MIRMINNITGSTMWVAESRLDEYLGAGHKLASLPAKPAPAEPVKRPPAKKSTKK
jgi:hypothetical protein